MGQDEAESQAELKAQELYEKICGWIEWQPEDPKRPTANKSDPTRVEIIKVVGALDIRVVAPDQFSVQAPYEAPKDMGETEMLETVKRWLGFPSYPPNGAG